LRDEQATDGFCSNECAGPGNPAGCGAPPNGITAQLGCTATQGFNICILECSGGKTCPGGMYCYATVDDDGPVEYCI
jgi:hypothetical protein